MSWGSAAQGAEASGQASQAASEASSAGTMAGATSLYDKMSGTPPASGFSAGINQPSSGMGPTIENATDLQTGTGNIYNDSVADMRQYGTDTPSLWDKGVSLYERFGKGQGQTLGETWANRGKTPETAGAAYGLLNKFATAKPQGGAAPITINASYQQPENEYLKKYARR